MAHLHPDEHVNALSSFLSPLLPPLQSLSLFPGSSHPYCGHEPLAPRVPKDAYAMTGEGLGASSNARLAKPIALFLQVEGLLVRVIAKLVALGAADVETATRDGQRVLLFGGGFGRRQKM